VNTSGRGWFQACIAEHDAGPCTEAWSAFFKHQLRLLNAHPVWPCVEVHSHFQRGEIQLAARPRPLWSRGRRGATRSARGKRVCAVTRSCCRHVTIIPWLRRHRRTRVTCGSHENQTHRNHLRCRVSFVASISDAFCGGERRVAQQRALSLEELGLAAGCSGPSSFRKFSAISMRTRAKVRRREVAARVACGRSICMPSGYVCRNEKKDRSKARKNARVATSLKTAFPMEAGE
jgi:hypothetical protein